MLTVTDFGGELLTEQHPTFRPSPGLIVVGVFGYIEPDRGPGRPARVVMLDLEETVKVSLAGDSMLLEAVERATPGDILAIEYKGSSGGTVVREWVVATVSRERLDNIGISSPLGLKLQRSASWIQENAREKKA